MKKLYIFFIMIAGLSYKQTTHTSMALIAVAVSQGNKIPSVLNQGQKVKVSKYKGTELTATDSSIVEISVPSDGTNTHIFTGLKPGHTRIMQKIKDSNGHEKDKRVADIHVAYTQLSELPSEMNLDGNLYVTKKDHHDTLEQTNRNDTNAGTVKIKTIKHNGQQSFKIHATNSGPVDLKDDQGNKKTITVRKNTNK